METNCDRCGTRLLEYKRRKFCPNCDQKPWEFEETNNKKNKKKEVEYIG